MNIHSLGLKLTLGIATPLLLASLACSGLLPRSRQIEIADRTQPIGFDFTDRVLQSSDGDQDAPGHVFVHNYPMPEDGLITGVIYLNDTDEIAEIFDLLVLRSTRWGWEVIHRVALPADENPPAASGFSTFDLDPDLPVNKGDVFGHWQPAARPTGPIPFSFAGSSTERYSVGNSGFRSVEVQPGDFLEQEGFTGARVYAINIIFKATR